MCHYSSSYWLATVSLIQTWSRPLHQVCTPEWHGCPYLTTLESLQMMCSWNMSLLSTLSISLRGTCRGRHGASVRHLMTQAQSSQPIYKRGPPSVPTSFKNTARVLETLGTTLRSGFSRDTTVPFTTSFWVNIHCALFLSSWWQGGKLMKAPIQAHYGKDTCNT